MKRVSMAHREEKDYSATRKVGKWVEHLLGPAYHDFRRSEGWVPAMNLYEEPGAYCMVVDLAGTRAEEIDLELTGRTLSLRGKRQMPLVPGTEGELAIHLMEMEHGCFQRQVELPGDVDAEAIDATYRCGLLLVRIPKKGES